MKLYKLTETGLEQLPHDHMDPELAELMACPVNQFTVLQLLELGECVLVNKVWIVPEHVITSKDVMRSDELTWSCRISEFTNRVEFKVTARDPNGSQDPQDVSLKEIVKDSLHLSIIRGYEQTVPDRHRTLMTKYGEMLHSDLEHRFPVPGRHEAWMVVASPLTEKQLEDKDNYEKRVLENGAVQYLELVHASQIAQS